MTAMISVSLWAKKMLLGEERLIRAEAFTRMAASGMAVSDSFITELP